MTRDSEDTMNIAPSDGEDYLEREVPEAIGEALAALAGGGEAPETLGGFVSLADSDVFSPGELDAEAMLITDESRHEVRLAERTVHTYCVLDALVLAFLANERVEIETRAPGAADTIVFTASPEGLAGLPEDAVVSFGFSTELPTQPSAFEDEAPADVQSTIHELGCPKINLFGTREAYETWARDADAVTMPIGVAEVLALARDTVERWPDEDADRARGR